MPVCYHCTNIISLFHHSDKKRRSFNWHLEKYHQVLVILFLFHTIDHPRLTYFFFCVLSITKASPPFNFVVFANCLHDEGIGFLYAFVYKSHYPAWCCGVGRNSLSSLLLYESSRFDQENCHSLCKRSKPFSPLKSTILNIPLKLPLSFIFAYLLANGVYYKGNF